MSSDPVPSRAVPVSAGMMIAVPLELASPRNGIALANGRWPLAAGRTASARTRCQVLQVAPFSVKLVGAALLLVPVPWMPSVTEPPAGMEPL